MGRGVKWADPVSPTREVRLINGQAQPNPFIIGSQILEPGRSVYVLFLKFIYSFLCIFYVLVTHRYLFAKI